MLYKHEKDKVGRPGSFNRKSSEIGRRCIVFLLNSIFVVV